MDRDRRRDGWPVDMDGRARPDPPSDALIVRWSRRARDAREGRTPAHPIGLLVPVAFAPDWIEWVFDAIGHRNREISHSLVSVGIGATLVALVYLIGDAPASDAAVVWLT